MADLKISALTASTTPLAGTEVLPIVQSSTTKQVSVANLTAGRAISATQITLTTGNVIVANGQGIDFSATPGTGTSELLADYEEGTWTATDQSGASLVLTSTYCQYTKVGNLVTVSGFISYPVTASASAAIIGGLPFTASATQQSAINVWNSAALNLYGYIDASTQRIIFRDNTNTGVTNVSLSNKFVCFSAAYTV